MVQLLKLTCNCILQRNGVTVQFRQNESRTKLLRLFWDKNDKIVNFVLSHQQSGTEFLTFNHKQIRKCINAPQMVSQGKLTFQIADNIEDMAQFNQTQQSQARANLELQRKMATMSAAQLAALNRQKTNNARMTAHIRTTFILLSNIEVSQLQSMIKILQDAVTGKPVELPATAATANVAKKRVLAQITRDPSSPAAGSQNDPRKVRKLNPTEETQATIKDRPKQMKLSFCDLPWDCISIIFDYTEHQHYKLFRSNRMLTWLINKRRKGLCFKKAEIADATFFKLLKACQGSLQKLQIHTTLKYVKKTQFEKMQLRPKSLRELDLTKLDMIGETSLARIIDSSNRTLQVFRCSAKNQGLSKVSTNALARCRVLTQAEFGLPFEYVAKVPFDFLPSIKVYLKKKQHALKCLKLYLCDYQTLQLLEQGPEPTSLEDLTIVKFNQSAEHIRDASELMPLSKMLQIKRLNLCSTYYPLVCQITDTSNEAVHTNAAISGSRELEQIFFKLRSNLVQVRLGDYVWDDFIIYLSELCKQLDIVEINSSQLTDAGVSHLLKRAEHMTALDLSNCSEFTGLAFADVDAENFKSKKLRWVQLSLTGHELQMAKNRLAELVGPNCQVILTQPKKYKLDL